MMNNVPATSLSQSVRAAILLIVLGYILIYLLPLGLRPLYTPDETRYGQIPYEMIQTGNWAAPHLVGLRYFEKPPMGYWLNAISIELFGKNNFAVRLPSALSAGLSAWFVWLLLIRLGFSRITAITSAAVYLSMAEVLIVGSIAVLDTPFSFFLTGGMSLFYLALKDPVRRRERFYLVSSGLFFGMAFLTKGFLAMVLPGLVILGYAIWQKEFSIIKKSLWAAAAGIITILPWSIIIQIREPDFWHFFFWHEHIRRFMEPNAQHMEPFYYFLMYMPVFAFPWLAYIPASISGLKQRATNPDLIRYLILWIVLLFLFFSVSKGKLATYVLPIFAPLAAYITAGIIEYLKSGKTRLFILGALINTLTLLILLAFVVYRQFDDPGKSLLQLHESGITHTLILSIIVTAALCLSPVFLKTTYRRIVAIVITVVPLFAFITLVVPHSSLARLTPVPLLKKEKHLITPDTMLVSDASIVRAVAWVLDRRDIYLLSKGELKYGLNYPDAKGRYLGINGLNALLKKVKQGSFKRKIAVFCQDPCPKISTAMNDTDAKYISNQNFSIWVLNPDKSQQ
jgi:4-amino-4-deoxy-L-arabinose transferase